MKSVLVVDDEKNIRDSLGGILTDEGFTVGFAGSAEEAVEKIRKSPPDIVLLDIWLPGMDGIEALKEIKKDNPNLMVIMISGHGTVETAVKATKLGAYDFLEKPLTLEKVVLTVEHALDQRILLEENRELIEREREKYGIIGRSRSIEELKKDIRRVAPTNSWVLITGENGTGKELVARNIHLHSNRSGKSFIAVNCAAIPEELIESELFGHEKGAFTSAVFSKKGKFDMADGGTIFLDEIGDMSLKTQAKILIILEGQSFERVGGTKKITVDARVVAATNKNLSEEIKKGNFREDLYYRLNVIPFHVPPLRERVEDIPLFVEYFLREFSREASKEVLVITDEAREVFLNYDWPGNVRELRNLMERLVIMTSSRVITPDDIPPYIKGAGSTQTKSVFDRTTLREARSDFEREFIMKKLNEFNGNIAKTAEAIGIERSHLYRKIKSYGIGI
ncbi:MAG: sigma-54-dependent Fis family transcriptional regulator [Deltaproteobacteria bacterium]|nr:sigma-54-dependent Fis family transcriptional regulator [Deltaproteobacteria bacterium]